MGAAFLLPGARLAASSICTTEPSTITAGLTVVWSRAFGDYKPADGFALKYYFRGAGSLNITADGTGANWLVTLKASDTAKLKKGTYQWAAYAEKGAGDTLERYDVARGVAAVEPSIVAANAGDLVSHEERMIALIECVLEGRIDDDVQQATMDGRSIMKIPVLELRAIRKAMKRKLWRKRNGGAIGQTLKVVMRRG